jgi:hypothetical protein
MSEENGTPVNGESPVNGTPASVADFVAAIDKAVKLQKEEGRVPPPSKAVCENFCKKTAEGLAEWKAKETAAAEKGQELGAKGRKNHADRVNNKYRNGDHSPISYER